MVESSLTWTWSRLYFSCFLHRAAVSLMNSCEHRAEGSGYVSVWITGHHALGSLAATTPYNTAAPQGPAPNSQGWWSSSVGWTGRVNLLLLLLLVLLLLVLLAPEAAGRLASGFMVIFLCHLCCCWPTLKPAAQPVCCSFFCSVSWDYIILDYIRLD